MNVFIEKIKREFHELLGLISIGELVTNEQIAVIAEELQKKLVAVCNSQPQEV
jgi:hypothetical protein